MLLLKVYWDADKNEIISQRAGNWFNLQFYSLYCFCGGNMQDLVNRLQSAQDLTQQLLVRL